MFSVWLFISLTLPDETVDGATLDALELGGLVTTVDAP